MSDLKRLQVLMKDESEYTDEEFTQLAHCMMPDLLQAVELLHYFHNHDFAKSGKAAHWYLRTVAVGMLLNKLKGDDCVQERTGKED